MFSVIDSEIMSDSPGVFPRLADDKALSVGVSPPLGQNNEQTSAAERQSQTELQTDYCRAALHNAGEDACSARVSIL